MTVNNRGFLGGAQLGYNVQLGPTWLLGVEADYAWSRLDGANSVTDTTFGAFNTTVEHKIDSFGTVRARLGLIAMPRILLYATGGLAFGDTRLNAAVTNLGSCALSPGCVSASDFGIKAGWTVGAGYEVAIGHNITWKSEYLYADLGSRSATITSPFGPAGNFYTASSEFQEHIFRTGLNFKFGAHD